MTMFDPGIVEFCILFDRPIDKIQERELRTAATMLDEVVVDNRSVVSGVMYYNSLTALTFCRNNSRCLLTIEEMDVYDHQLW